jgi:hypothetical protein
MGVLVAALSWITVAGAAFGREFVVDSQHPAAADTNPGSAEAPLSTIQRAADIVQPGDRVVVKAGRYPESVKINTSGTLRDPIVFEGAPQRGTLLDGAETLIGWKPCKSASECGGNAHFTQLYWTWLPKGTTPVSANLYEGETLLALAQDPPPPDPFFYDDRSVMRPAPVDGYSSTQIVDREYFTQETSDYWVGATVLVRTGNNTIRTKAGSRSPKRPGTSTRVRISSAS